MKGEFKGFMKIFSFTFRQHVKSKGYIMSGVLIGLLCLLLPVGIMTFMGRPQQQEEEPEWTLEEASGGEDEKTVQTNENIHKIYVIDSIDGLQENEEISDWYSLLNTVGIPGFSNLSYESWPDVETAAASAKGSSDTLLLAVEQGAYGQELSVLLPEESSLTEEDAGLYEDFLMNYYEIVQMAKAGIGEEVLLEMNLPVDAQLIFSEESGGAGNGNYGDADIPGSMEGLDEEQQNGMEMMKEILSMVLPYMTIMVLYFMILAYGQGVANSVIMEKNSKLVDTFLVTVRPGAMIMGKVLAIAASGLLQLFVWVACLVGSFAAGTALVKSINPENDMLLILLFDTFGKLSTGLFSVTGIVFTILILISGFLLYCALAAVGGAIASKPEDLSATNFLFTMALVISFLLALFGGALQGELSATNWMLYMPFTAILVAPGMALLGEMSILQCLASLLLILLAALVVIWAAGRVYKMLIFHKGDPVSVKKVLGMLVKKDKPVRNS